MIFINRAWNSREKHLLRALSITLLIFAVMNLLGGCAQVQDRMGGQVFGVSATLAGVSVSVSGTIPTGETPKIPAP